MWARSSFESEIPEVCFVVPERDRGGEDVLQTRAIKEQFGPKAMSFEAPPFYPELTPSWISCVLTALGRTRPDIASPYRFLVLGDGLDFHLALTAAANPTGHFTGIDRDPFAEKAGAMIGWKAGLRNLTFLKKGMIELESMPEGALEPFDFMVINDDGIDFGEGGHCRILPFARRFLKEGGVVLLRYATDPAGAFFPLAEEMIHDAGLAENPAMAPALAILRRIGEQGSPEPRSPKALFSADIISLMEGMGFTHAGSGEPLENIDSAYLPDSVATLVSAIENKALREAVKDIVRNQEGRLDLFQKGGATLSAGDHSIALSAQVFVPLPGAPPGGALTFETSTGVVKGAAEIFSPLLEALWLQPQSLGMLMHLPEFSGAPGLLNQASQMLLWANYARPLLPKRISEDPAKAFNRIICALALSGWNYGYLAAPALGGAVPAPVHAMVALVLLEKQGSLRGVELQRAVAGRLGECGIEFSERDKQELSVWESVILPQWARFGIISLKA
ncbi:hypothetical protein FACS1894205_7070 [Alphaproteobacteria bacterium]|nr:hypothetical protein FACS1894205_7070 [Alphaproteobacteria bacterium]